MNLSKADEDVIIDSGSSGPATPMASNPGTPRSVDMEVRSTPPPQGIQHSQSASSLQAMAMVNNAMSHSSSSSSLHSMGHAGVSTPASSIHQMQQQQLMQRAHVQAPSKYGQLLAVIEDMGKDIRPTYAGSKTSAERLKRGIVHARILVRECLMECERAART